MKVQEGIESFETLGNRKQTKTIWKPQGYLNKYALKKTPIHISMPQQLDLTHLQIWYLGC